jgi:carboxyl-terminal processing protease
MMKNVWLKKIITIVTLVLLPCEIFAQPADFNEVGKQMAIMLQNSHFARLPFSAELSQRFLDNYLKSLDSQRLYFLQQDVDALNIKYGGQLHSLLLNENFMSAATEIYAIYVKRVGERVRLILNDLEGSEFDFSVNESATLNRKKVAWIKNEIEAQEVWRIQIKKEVLDDLLYRDFTARLPSDNAKLDAKDVKSSSKAKIALHYQRKLKEIEKVSSEQIANFFLSAIAHSYDPHTDYLNFQEMNRFNDSMKNQLVGIGAYLHFEEDGAVKIKGLVVGGPADRGGILQPNDRIIAVDTLNTGKSEDMINIKTMELEKVIDLIQGEDGSAVALKIEQAVGFSGEAKVIVIQRAKVERKDQQASGQVITINVENSLIKRLGVITLPTFYSDFEDEKTRCSNDVEKILTRLMSEKIDGLVLDLRDNPGGSLEEVCRMTGLFIGSGPVAQVKNTLGQIQVKNSPNKKPIYIGPMVVMTNEGSASASEILAGALQDFNRAVIIGESSTFGKGTVQQQMEIGRMLPYFASRDQAGSLKLTIQKFYRPSGSSTQMEGVIPDIQLASESHRELKAEKFLDHALPHDRIRPAGNFSPLEQALFISQLRQLSRDRTSLNNDFAYFSEDSIKQKEKMEVNSVSLIKTVRDKELAGLHALEKERNIERKNRYAKISLEDTKMLSFYKLTLENIEKNTDLKQCHRADESSEYVRTVEDMNLDLDQTPKPPSGLDFVKRESLSILRDLIDLTDNSRLVGISDSKEGSN